MNKITIQGHVTPEGKLEVELPADFPSGPVQVEVSQMIESLSSGIPLGNLVEIAGIWKDRTDIVDSVDYARELRRRASRRIEE